VVVLLFLAIQSSLRFRSGYSLRIATRTFPTTSGSLFQVTVIADLRLSEYAEDRLINGNAAFAPTIFLLVSRMGERKPRPTQNKNASERVLRPKATLTF